MNPHSKAPGGSRGRPDDKPDEPGSRDEDLAPGGRGGPGKVRQPANTRSGAQGGQPDDKAGEAAKGPGSASADVGMTADGGGTTGRDGTGKTG